MNISDLLSAHNVILDAGPANKETLLDLLATEAASRIGTPKEDILKALQAREHIGSTALGKGVALPHTELRGTESPLVLFARLRKPIDFEARDDEPVDLFFLVLWPTATRKGLLPVMGEICQALRDPQSLRRLRQAETPDAVVQLVRQALPPNTEREPDDDDF
ncbi:PTS sugar transporter subunit IIA [Azospirillum tabaci]|uniref:PTS sugar transporter subunit IIA n=1 Tax=Azospirillum tabaci TaxID=2752310 RepID=UPI0016614027|nr:PTS sugar transporter subunit IIA [Azospirillum tabaci]